MVKKVLRIYYFVLFFFSLSHSFFFATYVLFLTQAGLDPLEVNLINCCYMASLFLFEVPTGVIADRYGRKFSFIVSCFIYSFSMFLYYASHSFPMFIVAEVIGALAATFYSGAFEAWMVDSVKKYDQAIATKPIFSKGNIISNVGVMIGTFSGAVFGKNNLALPWLMSSVSILILGIISVWLIKETKIIQERKIEKRKISIRNIFSLFKNESQRNFTIAKQGFAYTITEKSILFIVVAGFIYNFACMAPNMYWPLVFESLGVSIQNLGLIHFGSIFMIILGSLLLHFFDNRIKKERNVIVLSLVIFAIGLLIAVKDGTIIITLSGFYIHEFARGIFKPTKSAYLNSRIPAKYRATILSFDSMYVSAGSFFGLLIGGIIAKYYSISLSWLVSALIIIIFLPYLLFKKNGE